MAAVGELLIAHLPQICLMYQRGRIERLPRFFVCKLLRGQFAQLVVDRRYKLVGGVRIALVDRLEDNGDVAHNLSV